jgi:hypothetical protein
MSSAFLTRSVVERAVALIQPGVEALIKSEKRSVLYIVVLDPAAAAKTVLWEGPIGDPDRKNWQRDYAHFAHSKADLTHRTGLPAHLILRNAPHLYQEGDFKFGGSDIRNGIIVAASGLDWHLDYAVSGAIAALCHGFILGSSEKEYARDTHFIGEK